MNHRTQFITATILGVSVLLTLFVALGVFSLDLFVIISFLIFTAIVEVTSTDVVKVPWRRKLYRFIVVCLIFSSILLGRRVLELLPEGGPLS